MCRRFGSILACLVLVFATAGCGSQGERNALRSDVRRFRETRAAEYEQAKRDLARYARDNVQRAKELPIDATHYLEWRRREWWNLTDELAAASVYEWDRVEQLSAGVARYYGYQIRNFPRLPEDIARFFDRADPEWAGLVKDVVIFLEWRDREFVPLRKDIGDYLARVGWEGGNLGIDVLEFLEWRDREWRKLGGEVDNLMSAERQLGRTLRLDLRRFRAARAIEGQYLVADLSAWWIYETRAMPPRLLDDVWRWSAEPPRDVERLGRDIADLGRGLDSDTLKLIDEIDRFSAKTLDEAPALAAAVERFFDTYEREWGPLQAGVRRWWTSNVALGIVQREEMRRFFIDHAGEEAAELEAGMRRFISYGRKEWRDFKGALARFFYDDTGRTFGITSPMPSDGGHGVFDDPRAYPVRGYDAGY